MDVQADGLIELTWLEEQTWRDLRQTIRRDRWHIFHFIGHGGYDPNRREEFIALADEESYARNLPAEDLAELLRGAYNLRLVVLNFR